MGALDRIKRAVAPPVTAEWVDMVVTDRDRKASEIESEKGPEAAEKYREKSGKLVARMARRGIIPPAL